MFRNINDSIRGAFFVLLPLSVLALLWWTYVRKFGSNETLGPAAMGLVLGGAVGNLIDRLRFGYVIDFIDWSYPSSSGSCLPQFHFDMSRCHWPVFNIADSAITGAMILLIVYAFLHSREEKKERQSASAA
jgi:signal peptidase II